jgi:hypothetical protein
VLCYLAFYFFSFSEIGYVDWMEWIGVYWIGCCAVSYLGQQQRLAGAEGGAISSRLVLWRVRFFSLSLSLFGLATGYWVGTACMYTPQPRLVKGCLASTLSVIVIAAAVAMPLPLTLPPTQAASHRININHHQLTS